jgi:alkylated DNA repair protein alkB family protein 1
LIKWSLCEHARHPNETNLDAHYFLPPSGLWATFLHSPGTIIQPRAPSLSTSLLPDPPGPRHLISNTPASPATFSLLRSTPKPPPAPSARVQPLSAAELLPRLRWANIGWSYHWGAKQYDFAREVQPVNELFRRVCVEVVRSVHWGDIFGLPGAELLDGWGDDGPDWQSWEETYGEYLKQLGRAHIVPPSYGYCSSWWHLQSLMQASLTFIKQRIPSWAMSTAPRFVPPHPSSRYRESPVLVIIAADLPSISLGNAAIFLIGGLTRDIAPIPILLRSGDIVVMSGPACRRAYHGVPRILEGTLPAHLGEDTQVDDESWPPYARYMNTARININVRQVFPKGFNSPTSST